MGQDGIKGSCGPHPAFFQALPSTEQYDTEIWAIPFSSFSFTLGIQSATKYCDFYHVFFSTTSPSPLTLVYSKPYRGLNKMFTIVIDQSRD